MAFRAVYVDWVTNSSIVNVFLISPVIPENINSTIRLPNNMIVLIARQDVISAITVLN